MATDYTADANCRGAWLFSDDLTDESGEGNTLTASGSPAYSADRPTGYTTGKSIDLNSATPDYVYRTHANLSANFPGKKSSCQDFAIAYWAKWDNSASVSCPLAKYFGYIYQGTNALTYYQYDSGYQSDNTSLLAPITSNTWYHFIVSLNGDGTDTVATLWISTESSFGDIKNGTTDTLNNVGDLIVDAASSLKIGIRSDDVYPHDGHIFQPIFFDRTLSAAEAEEIYTNGINGAEGAAGNPYYAYAQQ